MPVEVAFGPPALFALLAALAVLPSNVPPVAAVHQLIVFADVVAFRFEVPPIQIDPGFAVTGLGAAGPVTVTVTGVRVADEQVGPAHETITCPFPERKPLV